MSLAPLTTLTLRIVAASGDQDRAAHRRVDGGEVIVLADGAGGTSGGREAAERIVQHEYRSLSDPAACVSALQRLDRELSADRACGESTAVLVVIRDGNAFGASVGDSGVWALTVAAIVELSDGQHRKPLLGSGTAKPVGFGPRLFAERLLVASDGLLKYAPRPRIHSVALAADIDAAADELVAAARLSNGALQDDLALVLIDPMHT